MKGGDSLKKLKLYLDTSFIGYLHQPSMPKEQEESRKLLELIQQGEFDVFISEVVLRELTKTGNAEVRNILFSYLNDIEYTLAKITPEVIEIAELIKTVGLLTEKNADDCLHIGCAVTNNCDVLVSWNFKHLANVRTVNGVRAISNLKGYGNINIVPPAMLIEKGDG
jgi:predicted nucleic acid-binding protein